MAASVVAMVGRTSLQPVSCRGACTSSPSTHVEKRRTIESLLYPVVLSTPWGLCTGSTRRGNLSYRAWFSSESCHTFRSTS